MGFWWGFLLRFVVPEEGTVFGRGATVKSPVSSQASGGEKGGEPNLGPVRVELKTPAFASRLACEVRAPPRLPLLLLTMSLLLHLAAFRERAVLVRFLSEQRSCSRHLLSTTRATNRWS